MLDRSKRMSECTEAEKDEGAFLWLAENYQWERKELHEVVERTLRHVAAVLTARDASLAQMTEYRDAWKKRAEEESNTRLLLSEDGLQLKAEIAKRDEEIARALKERDEFAAMVDRNTLERAANAERDAERFKAALEKVPYRNASLGLRRTMSGEWILVDRGDEDAPLLTVHQGEAEANRVAECIVAARAALSERAP